MCPNCRAFVSTADRVCPYCETELGPRAVSRRADFGGVIAGFIPTARFTTAMILFVNMALFLASSLTEAGRALKMAGAMYGPVVFRLGEWWRPITAGFFHGDVFHIMMNSWALFDLGAQVEELYGTHKLIFFYFVSTIGGFLLSGVWSNNPSVGSSAGIFGLIGVMIALGVHDRSGLGEQIRGMYTRWAIFGLVMSILPGIDMAAHLGGLAAGFGASYLAGFPSAFVDRRDSLWRLAAGGCLAITLLAFGRMFLKFLAISS